MQQRTRRLAIVFFGSVVVSLGALAACSTDNGTTPLPGAGRDAGGDSTRPTIDGDTPPDGDPPIQDDGGGADCGNAPRLRSNSLGFRCSFFSRDGGSDAGSPSNCYHDETCCNPGPIDPNAKPKKFPPSFCADQAAGAKVANPADVVCANQATEKTGQAWLAEQSSTWQCGDKNNCGGQGECCMFTWANPKPGDKLNIGPSLDKNIPASCNALQAFTQGGTRCAASCAADEVKLCSTDADCQGGAKCTAFSAGFRDLGTCRQSLK